MKAEGVIVQDGKLLVKQQGGVNLLERVEVRVDLNPGEHYYDQMVEGEERKVLTANAYDLICAKSGISIVCPEKIFNSQGIGVSNPEITVVRGMTSFVRVRVFAFGRNQYGTLTCNDLTLNYNLDAYFASNLMKKATTDTGWKKWAALVHKDDQAPPNKKLRVPLVTAGADLCCDMEDVEVIVAIREHQEAQQFAERTAMSMVTRNAVRKLLGIRYAEVDDKGVFVNLNIWPRSDMTLDQIVQGCANAKDGQTVIGGQLVTVQQQQADNDTIENEGDIGQQPQETKKEPTEDDMKEKRNAIRKQLGTFGSNWAKTPEVLAGLKELGFNSCSALNSTGTFEQLSKFLELISR